MEGKKLNLKWVSETIGEDYKNWKKGDVVRVQAQTGTGKTWFIMDKLIGNMKDYENLIYICNRIELKRQIKLDLLRKYNLDVPKSDDGKLNTEALDNITKIENVVITSYHAIAHSILDNTYNSNNNNMDLFDYIICDEMHFMLTDSSFNNLTRLAFDELIRKVHRNSVKIFISATMDEMVKVIEKAVEDSKNSFIKKNSIKLHTYNTGIDYSYLNTKYFKHIKDIITLIKNDKTNEKWLIFVTSKKNGQDIKNELDKYNISNEFITSGTKTEEAKNITAKSKFNCKALITTKALDNGVNIKDNAVKNLVVMAYDKTTFIQEIGRVRFNILSAPEINLFIRTCYKKTFSNLADKIHEPKFQDCQLYMNDKSKFGKKYHNNLSGLADDLFYIDNETKNITLNKIGYARLIKDGSFAKMMIKKFENEGDFAFIKEQLSWLGLEDTFNADNLIEDIIPNDEIETLQSYLDNIVDKKLFADEQQLISDLVIKELTNISKDVDYRTRKLKPTTLEVILRKQLELPYAVSEAKKESKGAMRGKRYIIISKIA